MSSDAIRDEPANEATAKLIRSGDELAVTGHAAPVVWALEAQTPAVAGAKLAGYPLTTELDPTLAVSTLPSISIWTSSTQLSSEHSAERGPKRPRV